MGDHRKVVPLFFVFLTEHHMTLLATTKLEAVNIMLAAIQEAPVSTIDDDTIEDAAIAVQQLDQVCKELQTKPWHFNTDHDYPLEVNADGKIPYPPTAAHCDPELYEDRDLVKRGNFFYDKDRRTFLFPAGTKIHFSITWMLDFEDMPMGFRSYCAMVAANRFANYQMGDDASSKYTEIDVQRAYSLAVADDLRRADLNALRGSRSVGNILRRRRTWHG